MTRLIKYIAELFGKIISFLIPTQLAEQWQAMLAHIYTGYVKRHFYQWGDNSVIAFKALRLRGLNHIAIGKNVQISKNVQITAWPTTNTINDSPLLIISDGCIIREGTHISAANRIIIGKHLLTGTNVLITDNSHGEIKHEHMDLPFVERPIISKGTVTIGEHVWLGNNVCVMPGVTIGNGAIIGANSVVTHDVPDYCVAVGVPAKVVKQL